MAVVCGKRIDIRNYSTVAINAAVDGFQHEAFETCIDFINSQRLFGLIQQVMAHEGVKILLPVISEKLLKQSPVTGV
ncbi:hypothetical protein SDC9_147283 [bioreactor metagenome]|uniref:Uncharacterized protein n=1 Tax=bioreactor metagenome TaxID=1076179 RepID=A0A645EG50_9ZZZZ